MRQILQNLKTGNTELADIATPSVGNGQILIKTQYSLISAGTEKMLVEFSKGGYLAKAKAQPDKVKQVLDKIRTDGLLPTLDTVFKRLDEPLPLGYCNVGRVIEVGQNVMGIAIGDMVVSNGPHAEYVTVPQNLCAKVPVGVDPEEAAFTVLSSIALQGIRLAEPTIGEKFVVYGVGLIGLVLVQLLKANGCEVLAIDISKERLKIAESFGAETCNPGSINPIDKVNAWTSGMGADGVIITASAKTDEIIHQSAEMCRKKGRIILVGVIGLNLRRSDFYEKELTFQVSCSYGPGRYDDAYELKGRDYPVGHVRWTEKRNFETILGLLNTGQLNIEPLITHRFKLEEASQAYHKISTDSSVLGVILEYDENQPVTKHIKISHSNLKSEKKCVAALIGAGNFSKMTLAPALVKTNAQLKYISDLSNSPSAAHIAKKYKFDIATSDTDSVLNDSSVNTVFIATGHNSHAKLVCDSMQAGKHVFVEKPLALTVDQLAQIIKTYNNYSDQHFMIGFNRRFSPDIMKAKELLSGHGEPLSMIYLCNAGYIPSKVWVHDPERGGGRIIGEACHFIDLMGFICDSEPVSVAAFCFDRNTDIKEDKMSINIKYSNGCIGTVHYFANGQKSYPKETIRIFSDGRILEINNFRMLQSYGFSRFRKSKHKMDKGHINQFVQFVNNIEKGNRNLIPFSQLISVTLASFAAMTSAMENRTINLHEEYSEIYQLLK
ncbi:Gfo/Idh/MocA family oxidoreductase [candidate division KSB1 bacterium]|nr:Gfo/Idh/MocA family oxidoreductase [candidate division KSB1 bacterium]